MGRCGADRMRVGGVRLGVLGGCRRLVVVGLVFACVGGLVGTTLVESAFACENEEFRTGPSASLPDCRAYELVTPTNLGRTQDMAFVGNDYAMASMDGEHLALQTVAPIEPNPSDPPDSVGARAVFSRTASGWQTRSAVPPGTGAEHLYLDLFSPDLSQVAIEYGNASFLKGEETPLAFEFGPVGGPYARIAAGIPPANQYEHSILEAANAGTATVPAFSDVLFRSDDHSLLPPGDPERALAEATIAGAPDLYDWTEGHLRLVNVEGEGAGLKLVNQCGAEAGSDEANGPTKINAVSEDGSRIFFTTEHSGATCEGPASLYMRVDGRETVEVSAPNEGVELPESERQDAYYDRANADGSEVFFSTEATLTAGVPQERQSHQNLYVYESEAPAGHRLTFVGVMGTPFSGYYNEFLMSEDGSTAYYETSPDSIARYEVATGKTTGLPEFGETAIEGEPAYATPNGEYFTFVARGVAGEPRGGEIGGPNELYRYDNATKSVMCVSCGAGIAPTEGKMSDKPVGYLTSRDSTDAFVQMSENGQEVFFQTTARLVPQDTNSTHTDEGENNPSPGMDVYEWEADGAEEAPGVFCGVVNGCTHLISSGEDVGPAVFLGASRDGKNVFFATAAQLVPQATPEFSNIYDARVDGGFPPEASPSICSSCQGVGSPPPLFSTSASGSFMGAGNPVFPVVEEKPKPKSVKKKSKKKKKKRKGRMRALHVRGGW
jgi:hypothetical protein